MHLIQRNLTWTYTELQHNFITLCTLSIVRAIVVVGICYFMWTCEKKKNIFCTRFRCKSWHYEYVSLNQFKITVFEKELIFGQLIHSLDKFWLPTGFIRHQRVISRLTSSYWGYGFFHMWYKILFFYLMELNV